MKVGLFILMLSAACFSFEKERIETLSSGKLLFTGKDLVNVYNISSSPLGLFQKKLSKLTLMASYNRLGWKDHSCNDKDQNRFVAPKIRAGEPRVAFLELRYDPSVLRTYGTDNSEQSIPLHNFGVTLAAKTKTDVIQISLLADGFYGKQSTTESASNRVILGLDQLRLDLATRFHEFIALGFYVGGDATVDTLYDHNEINPSEDRWFMGKIPVLGGYIDFGNDEFAVKSIAALQFSSSRFLYVSKGSIGDVQGGNQNALKADSLVFTLQTAGEFPVEKVSIQPALFFSVSNTKSAVLYPKGNNDNPLDLGQIVPGEHWSELKSSIGFGSTININEKIVISGEYGFTGTKISLGEVYTSDSYSRSSHTLNFVVKTDMHTYLKELKYNRLSPRLAYFFSDGHDYSSLIRSYSLPFSSLSESSQLWRYDPENRYSCHYKTSGFVAGVEGSIKENLGYDLYMSFLNRTSEAKSRRGIGFGLQTAFNL